MKKLPLILVLCPLLAGCMSAHIKPGRAVARLADVEASAVQSEDAKAATSQTVEVETISRVPISQDKTNFVETVTRKKVSTVIGAAQKNAAAEIAVKLASVRWVQWVGVLVALFGVASLVYPPLRLVVGSVTTSVSIIASGAAMLVLPLLVVGNELYILGGCASVAGLWFFAHRHGSLRGETETLKNYVQKSKN